MLSNKIFSIFSWPQKSGIECPIGVKGCPAICHNLKMDANKLWDISTAKEKIKPDLDKVVWNLIPLMFQMQIKIPWHALCSDQWMGWLWVLLLRFFLKLIIGTYTNWEVTKIYWTYQHLQITNRIIYQTINFQVFLIVANVCLVALPQHVLEANSLYYTFTNLDLMLLNELFFKWWNRINAE